MNRLTPTQMRDLARMLKKIVNLIDTYQDEHWHDISNSQHIIINARQKNILAEAHSLLTNAIIVSIENAEPHIQEISEVTNQIGEALKTISNIEKVVSIATSAASLAISLSNGNVENISASVSDIIDEIEN